MTVQTDKRWNKFISKANIAELQRIGAAKLSKHWHKMTLGGTFAYFLNALAEGNKAAGLMVALVAIGSIFHLGNVE
jgi:hypothetical protein